MVSSLKGDCGFAVPLGHTVGDCLWTQDAIFREHRHTDGEVNNNAADMTEACSLTPD